ncbi:MAG: hypothetical protein AAGG01_10605, partial [Planctomycetota bacterium]
PGDGPPPRGEGPPGRRGERGGRGPGRAGRGGGGGPQSQYAIFRVTRYPASFAGVQRTLAGD